MAKMKPGQISAKRAYEISDSLRKNADFDVKWASSAEKIAAKEKDPYVKNIFSKHADQTWRQAGYNYEKSSRLTSRADAAMAKANAAVGRDTPLPSSDGILGAIGNKLSEFFK